MACNSMYQKARGESEIIPITFFLHKELLLTDLKLSHILSNLKTSKKAIKTLFKYDVTLFTDVILYQHFLHVT